MQMKRNRKLVFAWFIYLTTVLLFVASVEVYHHFQKEHASNYQCRILINRDLIAEPEGKSRDVVVPKKEVKYDLYEKTSHGYIPRILTGRDSVFNRYSAVSEKSSKKKLRVAVLIEKENVDLSLNLNNQKITFIVPYYLNNLKDIVKTIRDNGHEFFLQIPTQLSIPADRQNSVSPFLANAETEETLDKLFYLIGSTKYALGIANTSSTLLTKSPRDIEAISNTLSQRGLAFLNTEASDDLLRTASEKNKMIYINAKISEDTNISRFQDKDIIMIRFELLDNLIKTLPEDWVLTPVSASVEGESNASV